MIDISKLTASDVGREVVYSTHNKTELGKITSWNRSFIFVRYYEIVWNNGTHQPRTGMTNEATSPEDLEFA